MNNKVSCYDKFSCIGDKCSITCCMQWKISVDDVTAQKWKLVKSKKTGRVLYKDTKIKDGQRVIKLNESGVCPFLDETGLCSLVTDYGEKMLSHTCDIFPRQINSFDKVTEYSLALSCPQVIKIISQEEKITMEKQEINELFKVRDFVAGLVNDESFSVKKALLMSFFILLDMKSCDEISLEKYNDAFLAQLSEGIDGMKVNYADAFFESNELFMDMSTNYIKEGIYADFLKALYKKAEDYENMAEDEAAGIYEAFIKNNEKQEKLLRKCIAMEIYSSLLMPQYDLDDIIIALEWIALEVTVARHALFLKNSIASLNAEEITECITIISRMTGYDYDDICEYLENSFESVFWEWGYMALIII